MNQPPPPPAERHVVLKVADRGSHSFALKVQHRLTVLNSTLIFQRAHTEIRQDLTIPSSSITAATSISNRNTASLLATIPFCPDVRFSDDQMTFLYRTILALPSSNYSLLLTSTDPNALSTDSFVPFHCTICNNTIHNPEHPLDCSGTGVGGKRIARHDMLVSLLSEMFRSLSMIYAVEPHIHNRDFSHASVPSQRRSDINVVLRDGDSTKAVDVAVINPSAPSNSNEYNRSPPAFFSSHEKKKIASYAAAGIPSNEFIPFISTAFGELGQQAEKLFNDLRPIAKQNKIKYNAAFWRARLAGKLIHALTAETKAYNRIFSSRAAAARNKSARQIPGASDLGDLLTYIDQHRVVVEGL